MPTNLIKSVTIKNEFISSFAWISWYIWCINFSNILIFRQPLTNILSYDQGTCDLLSTSKNLQCSDYWLLRVRLFVAGNEYLKFSFGKLNNFLIWNIDSIVITQLSKEHSKTHCDIMSYKLGHLLIFMPYFTKVF